MIIVLNIVNGEFYEFFFKNISSDNHITIINNNERWRDGTVARAGSYQPPDVGSSIQKENLFILQF